MATGTDPDGHDLKRMEEGMTHSIPDRAHLLTIDETCEALGIGRSKAYQLLMSGELASIKIGSRRLVAVTTIADYIERRLGSADRVRQMTRDVIEDLIEAGELRSVTLDNALFVSVDSLDALTHPVAAAVS